MKFQIPNMHHSEVNRRTHPHTHTHTHTHTHRQAESNMPFQLFQSWGHKKSEDLKYSGLSVPKFDEGDSAKFWLEKFNKAGTLKKWKDEEKCIHFCFALGHHAEDWYSSLTEEVKNDFDKLQASFLGRFESSADRVHGYSEFLDISQGSDSVDTYIEKVLKCGRKLKKNDRELIKQNYPWPQ